MRKIPLIFGLSIFAAVLITILSLIVIEPDIFTKEIIPETPLLIGVTTPNGTFYWPRDVATNSTGHIFVADTQNSRGQILFPNGTFIQTFGFPGNDQNDGSLNQPFGITINSTNFLYVSDTFTNVLKIYDPNGNYLKTIGSPGTSNGTFYYPSGIAINATEVYFIADTFNNRLQMFNVTDDTFIQTIPANKTSP